MMKEKRDNRKNYSAEQKKRPLKRLDFLLVLLVLFCGVLLASGYVKDIRQRRQEEAIRQMVDRERESREAQEKKKAKTGSGKESFRNRPEETEAYSSPIDFEQLAAINPDTVAWVKVEGTQIDYPVVQTTDNEKYLKTDFEGEQSSAGAIFLDCDSAGDLKGLHSILYGHHMKNKTMFAQLVKFKEESFFRENRNITIYTPERELHLKTIAAVYGDDSGEKRRTQFSSQEEFDSYVDTMTMNCSFRDLPKGDVTNLYSFVTCSYEFQNARTILYAVPEEDFGTDFD